MVRQAHPDGSGQVPEEVGIRQADYKWFGNPSTLLPSAALRLCSGQGSGQAEFALSFAEVLTTSCGLRRMSRGEGERRLEDWKDGRTVTTMNDDR